jgi:hypothetical protein
MNEFRGEFASVSDRVFETADLTRIEGLEGSTE